MISRRSLLLGSTLASAFACSESDRMAQNRGIPPWHMWGTDAPIRVPDVSDGTVFQQSQQLARVNYARPETWTFLLVAELLKAPVPSVGNLLVIVEYELIVGLGRSVTEIKSSNNGFNTGFCRFVWSFGAAPIYPTQLKWTTSVSTPNLDEGAAAPVIEKVSHFPAQDIQCNVKATVAAAGPPIGDTETVLNVHAYFAPRTHVRPSWWRGLFSGGEG